MSHVLALANQKGGVAKTTSTLNLGVALSELGNDVLIVDMDPQGNLTMSQGLDPDEVRPSMHEVLTQGTSIEDVIYPRELDLAVASIDLASAEQALMSMIGRERVVSRALMQVKQRYDFVLIDTPPSLGLLTINALTAADLVIVPVQCEYLSMRGLAQLQGTLELVQENLNPNVRLGGILLTMFDSRTLHGMEAVELVRESFGNLVFDTVIRKTIKFAEAPVEGSSVLKYAPTSAAAEAYRSLAKEVLNGKKI